MGLKMYWRMKRTPMKKMRRMPVIWLLSRSAKSSDAMDEWRMYWVSLTIRLAFIPPPCAPARCDQSECPCAPSCACECLRAPRPELLSSEFSLRCSYEMTFLWTSEPHTERDWSISIWCEPHSELDFAAVCSLRNRRCWFNQNRGDQLYLWALT